MNINREKIKAFTACLLFAIVFSITIEFISRQLNISIPATIIGFVVGLSCVFIYEEVLN